MTSAAVVLDSVTGGPDLCRHRKATRESAVRIEAAGGPQADRIARNAQAGSPRRSPQAADPEAPSDIPYTWMVALCEFVPSLTVSSKVIHPPVDGAVKVTTGWSGLAKKIGGPPGRWAQCQLVIEPSLPLPSSVTVLSAATANGAEGTACSAGTTVTTTVAGVESTWPSLTTSLEGQRLRGGDRTRHGELGLPRSMPSLTG